MSSAGVMSTSQPTAPPVHEPPVTVIRPRRGWIAIDWRELWSYRELLLFLTMRDIKVRYKQTVLGVAWAVLQPTFTMLVFTLIFGAFAKMPSGTHPYAVFAFVALIPWTFFATAVGQAGLSLVNQQTLLTKVYLPRLFIPAANVGGALVDMAISFGVLAVLMLILRVSVGPAAVAVAPLALLTTVLALGVGLSLAALTVTYRDFRHAVPFMLQIWMYLSPIIWSREIIPARYKQYEWLLGLNPMTGVIDGFRAALLGDPWNWTTLAMSVAIAVVMLFYGMFYFRRTERRFADIA
jgi:lipopolysaccharide transport system permease protein